MTVLRLQGFGGAGMLLGFALGGFFDGILLHQILQWHHLLSGIRDAPFDDIGVQILADGLFHAAMYFVAAIGLWKLFRARVLLSEPEAGRLLAAQVLIGFGLWHVVDTVLSHWLLGLHRIRMDTAHPLFWDLLWFMVFGVLFIAAGAVLLRRRGAGAAVYGMLAPWLAVLTIAAAGISTLPSNNPGVTVVMQPGAAPARLLSALNEIDARVVWSNPRGDVWVLTMERPRDAYRLYAHGALLVSGSLLPAGCSAWIKT